MRKLPSSEPKVDQRKADDQRKLRSRWVTEDLERQLVEVGGFTKPQIYNRRGSLVDRGFASLLEQGDTVLEVLPGRVRIKTREGTIQTFHSLDVEHDWLKKSELPPAGTDDPADPGLPV